MLNIAQCKRDANQNYNEISPHSGQNGHHSYVTICNRDSQQEFAVWLRKLKQGLCINLEGWGGEGDGREGTYVYLWLIHVEV